MVGRIAIITIFVIILGFAGYQAKVMSNNFNDLNAKYGSVKKEASILNAENIKLKKNVDYLNIPENIIKEIKARFNYRFPDEKLIIVVPNDGANKR